MRRRRLKTSARSADAFHDGELKHLSGLGRDFLWESKLKLDTNLEEDPIFR